MRTFGWKNRFRLVGCTRGTQQGETRDESLSATGQDRPTRRQGMLESLFTPGTVAVIGASATPGKVGYAVMSNLVNGGFDGTIVPVNPRGGNILGIKAYKDPVSYTHLRAHETRHDLVC